MLNYLLTIGTAYILVLMFFSWRTKNIKNSTDFMFGGSKIGVAIGLMTFVNIICHLPFGDAGLFKSSWCWRLDISCFFDAVMV